MRRVTIEIHGADDEEMERILAYWFPPMGLPDAVNAGADTHLIRHEDGLACEDECDYCNPEHHDEADQ